MDHTERGNGAGGIPPGFERCPACGEYNGETLAKQLRWEGGVRPADDERIRVSCLCHGVPCRRCGKNLVHRPVSNSYDPKGNEIGHWPWFAGQIPCRECARREREEKGRDS